MVRRQKFIIGIDEVGRGPLAGPVVVAGIKSGIRYQKSKFWKNLKDSKRLSPQKREEWFGLLIRNPRIKWAVASVSPKVIDRINITRAANLAARRVYKRLANKEICPAVLDGGLYLDKKTPHKTIIKGDEKMPIIAAASIIAKVSRDRIMVGLHKKFPQYRFDIHKGYGTKFHRGIIKKLGLSKVHRRSFRC